MGYIGINLGNVKVSNRSAILKLLNDRGAMSRKDIAAELGLTPATVTLICSDLLSQGILCEKGELEEAKRAGRRKVLIDINYQYRYVLSVRIEVVETSIAISNLKGKECYITKLSTDGTMDPEMFLKKIANESKSLMWEHGIGKEMVLGAGVSVPGTVNRNLGISQHAYRIWKEPVSVGDILKGFLNLPVIVENNVKAFAEAELIYGNGREQENLLLVKWSPGVGSAIIIGNRLYDSQNSKTAEIGHCTIEKNGKLCGCGKRGCLETRATTHAIAEAVRSACTERTMPVLYQMVGGDIGKINVENIMQWIECGDEGMWAVLDDIFEVMARVVMNTVTIIAPGKVILYGQMFESQTVMTRFIKKCKEYDPSISDDYLVKSRLSKKIEYIGPLSVAVNELLYHTGSSEE